MEHLIKYFKRLDILMLFSYVSVLGLVIQAWQELPCPMNCFRNDCIYNQSDFFIQILMD